MAIYERPKTQQQTGTAGRPDFAAISRRAAERNREALAILEAHDRGDTGHGGHAGSAGQATQLRRAG